MSSIGVPPMTGGYSRGFPSAGRRCYDWEAMHPSNELPLDYAKPDTRSAITIEKGLSKGRMAFLLFGFGLPLASFFIGLPFVVAGVWLAVVGCIQSQRRSMFAWIVLGSFAIICTTMVIALIYGWITGKL